MDKLKRITIVKNVLAVSMLMGIASLVVADSSTGQQVFSKWCDACHMDSPFAAGTIQLKQTRGADLAVIEKRTDLTEPMVRTFVRSGFAGMPKFRRMEISDADLDALIKYLVKP